MNFPCLNELSLDANLVSTLSSFLTWFRRCPVHYLTIPALTQVQNSISERESSTEFAELLGFTLEAYSSTLQSLKLINTEGMNQTLNLMSDLVESPYRVSSIVYRVHDYDEECPSNSLKDIVLTACPPKVVTDVLYVRFEQIILDTFAVDCIECFSILRILMLYPWSYSTETRDTANCLPLPEFAQAESRILEQLLEHAPSCLRVIALGSFRIWLQREHGTVTAIPLAVARSDTILCAIINKELTSSD